MIIQLSKNAGTAALEELRKELESLGIKTTAVNTPDHEYLVAVVKKEFDIRRIGALDAVQDVHRVSDDYKLVSRKWKVDPTAIDLNGISVREGNVAIMAGPCSIEGE